MGVSGSQLQDRLLHVFLFLGTEWILYLLLVLSIISVAVGIDRLVHLLRHRDDLVQTRLQQQNRLRDTSDKLVRSSLETLLKVLASEIEAVERTIKEHLKSQAAMSENLSLLTSIVGISLVTAAKLLAEFAELEQYASAKAAAATSKVMKDPKASKEAKTAAASTSTQRPGKK